MKKICLALFLVFPYAQVFSQNSISIDAGYLRSHTNVSEYLRTGRSSNLMDSVKIYPDVNSFQADFHADFDLGKRFYFSTGFHYARKGLAEVDHADTVATFFVHPIQHYVGLSFLVGYRYQFKHSRFGLLGATGPQVDFAVGKPNNGALYSGTYQQFFMPFSRFNEVDLSWTVEAGPTFRLGPGDAALKLCYKYGLSDVLEDAFIIGRSSSFGITLGYSIRLTK